ncbi:MAG TPA: SDR family oxidoreductase [Gaiellaceae bacterium]|nr:SDR family oxidoreductase [Gaiellaceae bacterium]
MSGVLAGRTALVAGAGRGIGRAIALAYAREGAKLALLARSRDQLEAVAEECGGALCLPCDVASWDAVADAVQRLERELGPADVLASAAGVYGPIGPTAEIDAQAWAQAIDVNLVGAFHLCRAVVPAMENRSWGRVILLAGGGATAPLPFFSAYAASKAGLVRLAETLAEELRGTGVTVNAVAPGLVDTQMQDEVLAAGDRAGPLLEKIRAARETGAGAVPPEVAAELAVFLASDASAGLTGKLVAAPHDPWRDWTGDAADRISAGPWYTIRRLDRHTLEPLLEELG